VSADIVNIPLNTSTPTQLPVGLSGTVIIFNPQATNHVYLGTASSLTANNGVRIPDGSTTSSPLTLFGITGQLWAICDTGAQTIGVIAT
jgi:hypothetical protein